MVKKKSIPVPDAKPDDLICACKGLRVKDYHKELKENPELSFEDVLNKTGAGSSCTACLLDLEYFYVSLPREKSVSDKAAKASMAGERSLKRKIFDFIDKISPSVPYKLANRFPIISGAGIDQHIWVSNRSLLFEGDRCGPSFDVDFTARDAAGNICHRQRLNVEPEAALNLMFSKFITPPQDNSELAVGSVEVIRRGRKQGFRGTTRPQTEILARDGTCSVHGQSYKYPGEKWFSLTHIPKDQRVFLSFINFAATENKVTIEYPMNVEDLQLEQRCFVTKIPGNGAHIHEIKVTNSEATALAGRHLAIKWSASAEYNCHIVCASSDLGRFSIDHS